MNPYDTRNSLATQQLIEAFSTADLGHSRGRCAVSVLLGGEDWMEAIEPRKGTIDHQNKLAHPRRFAAGLRQIQAAGFSVEEIIDLEARFEGRAYSMTSAANYMVSSFDDSNDPDGAMGLNAVIQYLTLSDVQSPAPLAVKVLS